MSDANVRLDEPNEAIMQKLDELANFQGFNVDENDFATTADALYDNITGGEGIPPVVPDQFILEQRAMSERLNRLIGRTGVMHDVHELFDTKERNVLLFDNTETMGIEVKTNSQELRELDYGYAAFVSFDAIPLPIAQRELAVDEDMTIPVIEKAFLTISRDAEGLDGGRLRVEAGRNFTADWYTTVTNRKAVFYFDPRDPSNVLPYVKVGGKDMEEPGLAKAGSPAWDLGIQVIHQTIDLVDFGTWPTTQIK